MRFFFDTSALVKFFYVESGTRIVTQIMEYADSEIWISDLARLEFTSALYRRYRNKTLDEIKLHIATTYFDKQLGSFNIEPLNQLVIDEAGLFLKKYGKEYGLRTLDALHLGTYSLISEHGWCFVTSDSVLADVSNQAGFLSLNPQQTPDIDLNYWIKSHA
ncbi:MAG: type II toxin-antitoxin system VapC family toxin [Deltaproteobacteria bacterium]|nr:type II toxin-antitoxin system VapC family toxin [Deltaproteobacteria bacterium]